MLYFAQGLRIILAKKNSNKKMRLKRNLFLLLAPIFNHHCDK